MIPKVLALSAPLALLALIGVATGALLGLASERRLQKRADGRRRAHRA